MLTKRLLPLLQNLKTMPDHQFGFRKQHSTIEQIHRLTRKISQDLEKKKILLCGIPGHSAGVR